MRLTFDRCVIWSSSVPSPAYSGASASACSSSQPSSAARNSSSSMGSVIAVDDVDGGGGGDGLAREDPAFGHLVGRERVVDEHRDLAVDDAGHARGAAARLA